MTQVRYSQRALADLDGIGYHFARVAGIDVAVTAISKIRTVIQRRIVRFPNAGRLRPEFGWGIRSYPSPPYIIFYVTDPSGIEIIRVLHGHRDLQAPLMSLLVQPA